MKKHTILVTILRGVTAGIIAVLVFTAMLSFSVNQVFLNPLTYIDMLEKAGLYETVPEELANWLSASGGTGLAGSSELSSSLSRENYAEILNEVMSAQWLREQVDGAVLQVFTQLALNAPEPVIEVDLSRMNSSLVGSTGALTSRVLFSWPACTEIDIQAVMEKMLTGTLAGLPFCRPPEPLLSMVDQMVSQMVQAAVLALPGKLVLAGAGSEALWRLDDNQISFWRKMCRFYRLGRTAFPLAGLGVFAAGLVMVLLTFRRPQDLLVWSGTALAVAGMLLLGISLGSLLTGRLIPGALFHAVNVKEPALLLSVINKTFQLVVNRFVVWTALEAIVAVGVGLGSVLVGRNLR